MVRVGAWERLRGAVAYCEVINMTGMALPLRPAWRHMVCGCDRRGGI